MSKSNTAVKKNRHLIAITIITVLSCLIIVAATSIGVTVTKANGKKLSFDVDGQAVATIRVTSKEEVVLPTPEQKIGYTFSGWYFDKDTFTEPCTEETIKEKKFKSGTSVHAKWLKNDYTITYNLDSGENAKTNPNGYVVDTATIALVNPFKLGFTFDGWYSEDTFTTKVTEIAAGSTGDKTLFAKWIKNEFSIIYKNLEGATNNALNPGGYDVTTATIALADASRDGYTFDGWYDANVGGNKVTEITTGSTGEKTIFARWKAIEYGIVYNLNGGVNAIANPATYTIDNATALAAPTKTGFTFEGWFAKADFSGNAITEIAKGSMDAKTVFAKWSVTNYDITYELNGQFVDNPNGVTNYHIYSPTITLKNASRNGYTFEGWYDANVGGSAVTEITKGSTGNKTIFARWKVVEYTITYNLDGGENSLANPSKYTIESDTIVFDKPTKLGYTFDGWYDAKAVANSFDNIMTGSTGNATVYAKWTASIYSVAYILTDANNDHGNITLYKSSDSKQTLKKPTSKKNWLAFVGWFDAPTGGNEVTTIGGGALGNLTLYDRWDFVGSPNLAWNKAENDTVWEVARGGVSGIVGIPSKHNNDGLPVRIKAEAFNGVTGITSVIIDDGVTGIGYRSFMGCTSLTSIDIPNSVKSIGIGAFYNCNAIKSIVIPDGVTNISEDTFRGCTALINIDIPNSVTSIDKLAFYLCTSITSIKLPNKVDTIGQEAFNTCSALTSVNIPDTVTSIGSSAFYKCSALRTIFIPKSVTYIDSNAFNDCTNIVIYCEPTSAPVYDSTNKTGWFNNAGTYWYGNVNKDTNIKWGQILSTDGFIYEADGSNYKVTGSVGLSGAVTIPSTFNNRPVTSIGEKAFYYQEGITSVVIPDSVTSIGKQAFSNCKALTSVNIPSSVTTIGKLAFLNCEALASVVLPKDLKSIGGQTFQNCEALVSLNMPKGLLDIGEYAFRSCISLTSLNIPDTVTNIGELAISNCTSLKSIFIPASVTNIGANAFQLDAALTIYCERPSSDGVVLGNAWNDGRPVVWGKVLSEDGFIYVGDGVDGYIVTGHSNPTGALVIPEKFDGKFVTAIAANAFKDKTAITSVVIPDSVTSMGEYAFYGCSQLKSVKLSNKLMSIGAMAFQGCVKLTSVKFPNTLTSLANQIFYGCSALTSVEIPNSVKSIGNFTFQGCSALKSVKLPNELMTMGYNAFKDCTSLTSVNIPSTLTSIGANAFDACAALTGIYIPKTVTTIGSNAFLGCTKIRIYCEAEVAPAYNSGDSSGWYSSGTTYWYGGISVSYIHWSQIPSEDGYFYQLNSDSTYAVSGHIKPTGALNIPGTFNTKDVTRIADYAFYDQDNITSVVIQGKVISIGQLAFQDCDALTSAKLPDSMIIIGQQAFYSCDTLASINIPYRVQEIGIHAISNCLLLPSVFVPKSVKTIRQNAFYYGDTNNRLTIYFEAPSSNHGIAFEGDWNKNVMRVLWNQTLSADGLIYEEVNVGGVDSYRVTGCDNLSGEVVIPETFNGRPVTSIGNKAFYYQDRITSIVIPKGVTSIGDYAFHYCKKLANVVLPEGLKSIGEQSFIGCSSLTSVTLPSTLLTIGVNAFNGCTSLASINLPSMLETISTYAFYNCSALTSIYIPYSVVTVGEFAVYGCTNLTIYCERTSKPSGWYHSTGEGGTGTTWYGNVSSNKIHWGLIPSEDGWFYKDQGIGGYTVVGGVNLVGEVNIPSMFNGRVVSKIDDYAFFGENEITSVVIPDTVMTIGVLAFYGCSGLKSVVIPDSVTLIRQQAFDQCKALTSVAIPDSVTTIESYAFRDCTSLTSVNIPNRVTRIEGYTFAGCTSLTSIFLPRSVTGVGDAAFLNCSKLLIYVEIDSFSSGTDWQSGTRGYLASQSISEDGLIFRLSGDAYNVSGSTKVSGDIVIPSSFNGKIVNEIRTNAFFNYVGITSVTIPDSVTKIGDSAFYGCTSLKSVKMATGVQTIGQQAFQGCSALTSVNIPSSVTSIGVNAFYGCTRLPKIFIPKSVTTIDQNAFYNCTSLIVYCETLSAPSGWNSAWYGNSLDPATEIKWGQILAENGMIYEEDGKGGYILNACLEKISGDIVIGTLYGRPVTSIADNAFYGNTGITSVVIQNGVTSIGAQAFYNCSSLTSVVIPDSVTSIGASTFRYCVALASINIPSKVKTIGVSAFSGCIALTSVNIPSGVTSIGANAFQSCKALTSVTLPSGVTSIGASTFRYCVALASINIPTKVKTIGVSAFSGCSALTSVTIPNSVINIGDYAFWKCTSLTNVNIPNSVTSIGDEAFLGCTSLTSVVIPSSVTSIGARAFSNCNALTSVDIPSSVTTIEASTFAYCTAITSINISSGVTSIELGAFIYCSALTSVVIPDSVTTIGAHAFNGCRGLKSVVIQNGVASIGEQAFAYCRALSSIYIPSSVTTIRVDAFYGCTSITISCQAATKPNGWDAAWMGNVKDTNITWNAPVPAVKP